MGETPQASPKEPQWGDNKLTRTDIRSLAREPAGLANYNDQNVQKIVDDLGNTQITKYLGPESIAGADLETYANNPKPFIEQVIKRGFLPPFFMKDLQSYQDRVGPQTMLGTSGEFCKAINSISSLIEKKFFMLKILLRAVLAKSRNGRNPVGTVPTIHNRNNNYDIEFVRLVHQYQTELTQYSNKQPFSKDCIVGNQVRADLHRRIFGKAINIKGEVPNTQNDKPGRKPADYTDRRIDGQEVILTAEEQAVANRLIRIYPHIPKEQIMTTVCGAKAAGIVICYENMIAAFTLRGIESQHQVNVHKTREQIQVYIRKIEKLIDKITYILDDTGDKYFYGKLYELKQLANKGSVNQAKLFEWTNTIVQEITAPGPLHRALYERLVTNKATATAASAGYRKADIETFPGENNFDVLVRSLRAKPGSFGKYEIMTDVLVSKILTSDQAPGNTEQKIVGNRGQSAFLDYDKMNLVYAMQGQPSTISQIEMEKVYRQYFFKDEIALYSNGTGRIQEENIQYFIADHNAGPFACRNCAIQYQLNKKLNENLALDGDLTGYDILGQPGYTNSYTVQALTKYVDKYYYAKSSGNESITKQLLEPLHREANSMFKTKDIVEKFVKQSRSLALQENPLYQHIMQGSSQPFMIPNIKSENGGSVKAYSERGADAYRQASAGLPARSRSLG